MKINNTPTAVTLNVLVIGDFKGHFRSQIFIERLLKNDFGAYNKIVLSFVIPSAFKVNYPRLKVFIFILNIFFSILYFFEILIKIPFCDKIYFMAMNHKIFPKVLFANFIWRKPIIADMYISIYDASNNRNLFTGFSLKRLLTFRFEWYYKYLDKLLIEKPYKTIYVGDLEIKKIAKLVNADIKKSNYVVIPPCSLPKRKVKFIDSNIFRICWWGTFTPFHGVENIINTAYLLKKEEINFSLNLFGTPKDNIGAYIRMVEELKLTDKITFHNDKTFSNSLLEEYLFENCDLALGNFSTTERALRAVPTKIIDAFSMSLPVLTMDTEVLRDSIDVNNELFACLNSPSIICAEIIKIINNPDEKERRANNGFLHYERTFSKNVVQEKFISLFKTNL